MSDFDPAGRLRLLTPDTRHLKPVSKSCHVHHPYGVNLKLGPVGHDSLLTLRYGLDKRAEFIQLFHAAAPDQLAVMDGDIRATVAHVLSAVGFKIHRLNDH